ncbi:MAG: DUF2398 family protein, partial [Pseudonocardiaceae bacterium]
LVTAGGPVPDAELAERAAALLGRFPSWAKNYRSEDGAARLAADAVDVLCAFKLASRGSGTVRALPAAARFAIATPVADTASGELGALSAEPSSSGSEHRASGGHQ